jgi:predicted transcriptional regulator
MWHMAHHFQESCAYFTAAKYMRAVERHADVAFAPTGMKPAYSYIMLTLEDGHPQSVTKLADILGYERSSMSRMVKTLAAKQLVELSAQGRTTQVDLGVKAAEWLPVAEECLAQWGQTTNTLLGQEKKVMVDALVANTRKLEE